MHQTRKKSIVEVAEAHFDKNTIILFVNVLILIVLIAILYIVASSALNAGPTTTSHFKHRSEH